VTETGQLVFRADMPRVAASQLYWRGTSFSRLDGLRWLRDPPTGTAQPPASTNAPLSQIITMEPGSSRTLIGLDMPISFSHANGTTIPWASWNRPLPASRRLRYQVYSAFVPPPPITEQALISLTRLPNETPPRLRQLSQQLRQAGNTDQQRLAALEAWFLANGFSYSRTDLPTGVNALERFLFETRRGHCEFFASGFALLARGAGLPARLVGGYYGGEYNELGGYYRVADERAHVWVEVWQRGSGWLRIDPSSFSVNADAALGEPRQRSLLLRLRMVLDSLDHTWNSAIISYDLERQLQTAGKAHSRLQSLRQKDLGLFGSLIALLAASALSYRTLLQLRRNGLLDRNTRLLRRFRRAVERGHGIPRSAPFGLMDLAHQVDDPQVQEFIALYARSLYGNQPLSRTEYKHLSRLVRRGFGLQ